MEIVFGGGGDCRYQGHRVGIEKEEKGRFTRGESESDEGVEMWEGGGKSKLKKGLTPTCLEGRPRKIKKKGREKKERGGPREGKKMGPKNLILRQDSQAVAQRGGRGKSFHPNTKALKKPGTKSKWSSRRTAERRRSSKQSARI